jgi:hypothetical protein
LLHVCANVIKDKLESGVERRRDNEKGGVERGEWYRGEG